MMKSEIKEENEYGLIHDEDYKPKSKRLKIEDGLDDHNSSKVTLNLGDGKVFYFKTENDIKDNQENGNQCSYCQKKFVNQKVLKMHVDSQHLGLRSKCPDCDKDYDNKANLRRHIRARHEAVGYQCEECDHVSSDYSNMKRHRKQIHSSEVLLFDCPRCAFTCNDKGNLKRHIERIHLKQSPRKNSGRRKVLPIE